MRRIFRKAGPPNVASGNQLLMVFARDARTTALRRGQSLMSPILPNAMLSQVGPLSKAKLATSEIDGSPCHT